PRRKAHDDQIAFLDFIYTVQARVDLTRRRKFAQLIPESETATTAFRVIPGHDDITIPCWYSGHGLFGERAQQRDPYAPLCGIRYIQPTHLIWGDLCVIWGDLCDIDDRLV